MSKSVAREPLVAGVDLGGTKILAGLVDTENRILGRAKSPTPSQEGNRAILAAIVEALGQACASAGVAPSDLTGIGLGSPGPLDPEAGVIPFSANLNVRDFAIGPDLSRATGLPVLVRNDVRVGGYGEFRLGAGRGYRNVLAAFVGTGIGGCVIIDGVMQTGSTGNAGEVGHVIVKPRGPKCGCGRRGCLEALASRTAIARRIIKAHKQGIPTSLGNKLASGRNERLKSKELAAAYQLGDPVVIREVQRSAHYLGLALGGLVNVLGPQIVIVGGGVTEAMGEDYLHHVRESAWQQMLFDPERTIPIVAGALGDDAGLLGAALLAREKFVPIEAGSIIESPA
jgi:glucokinase